MKPGTLLRCAAAFAALLLTACGKQPDTPGAAPAQQAIAPDGAATDLLARGRYLVTAADCAACHTAVEGAPFAGGVKLDSPFGTFYGSNITPDKEYGIGQWRADDFYRALHDGVAPDKTLYPAMPYTSYRQLSRADSDAMYAFLMTQQPVHLASPAHDLKFPYNLRFGVRFWNLLFLKDALPDASSGQSTAWLRGRYLANALGHCAECHTPRATFGQLDPDKSLRGSTLQRIGAPDITPHGLAARGWQAGDLQAFLASGISRQGSAFGDMFPVVHLSTQYLTQDDLSAISTYLLGDQPPAPQALPSVSADAAQLAAGRRIYLAVCAGCHGMNGEGKPHVAVALQGNSTLRHADPHNLIVSMLDGIAAQDFPGLESMQAMPGFAGQLSDDELAQLANYVRATYGGQPADVSAQTVKKLH